MATLAEIQTALGPNDPSNANAGGNQSVWYDPSGTWGIINGQTYNFTGNAVIPPDVLAAYPQVSQAQAQWAMDPRGGGAASNSATFGNALLSGAEFAAAAYGAGNAGSLFGGGGAETAAPTYTASAAAPDAAAGTVTTTTVPDAAGGLTPSGGTTPLDTALAQGTPPSASTLGQPFSVPASVGTSVSTPAMTFPEGSLGGSQIVSGAPIVGVPAGGSGGSSGTTPGAPPAPVDLATTDLAGTGGVASMGSAGADAASLGGLGVAGTDAGLTGGSGALTPDLSTTDLSGTGGTASAGVAAPDLGGATMLPSSGAGGGGGGIPGTDYSAFTGATPTDIPNPVDDQTGVPPPPVGSGGDSGLPKDILDKVLKFGPLALGGLGLLSQRKANNPANPSSTPGQIKELAAPLTKVGTDLIAQAQAGQLNPADAYRIEQWRKDAVTQAEQYYAKAGISDSSMKAGAIADINARAVAMQQQAQQNLLQQGINTLQAADQFAMQGIQAEAQGNTQLATQATNFLSAYGNWLRAMPALTGGTAAPAATPAAAT